MKDRDCHEKFDPKTKNVIVKNPQSCSKQTGNLAIYPPSELIFLIEFYEYRIKNVDFLQ